MPCTIFIPGEPERYANYSRAVSSAGGSVCFSDTLDPALTCDGLLLPGGGDLEPWRYGQLNTDSRGMEPERDAMEFALLDRFTAAQKPVLGICRGLQTINVYWGGSLAQDIPGHGAVNGKDHLHSVRTEDSFLSALCGEYATVNSAHHQAVERLGHGLCAVQRAADGVIEAVAHQTLPVWGVQWHPERLMSGSHGRLLFQAFLNLCRKKNL